MARINVTPAAETQLSEGQRLRIVKVGDRYVAHALAGSGALRNELLPADAVVRDGRVQLLREGPGAITDVAISGCTPALSLWLRLVELLLPDLRIFWRYANSTGALQALARGEVHGAGAHLVDFESGDCNTPFVRRHLPHVPCVLVNLGQWEEGLVVARGNPLGIRSVADLVRPEVRLINREEGTSARLQLCHFLEREVLDPERVNGWNRVVYSQVTAVREVARGTADVACGAVTTARMYGLDFIPLVKVRFDVVFPEAHWEEPSVQQLVATLKHPWVRSQLLALDGFDASRTGDVVART